MNAAHTDAVALSRGSYYRMPMRPERLTVYELFQKQKRFVVPLFQRPYVWNEEDQWHPLWEDIENLAEEIRLGKPPIPHFLGAVVLNQIPTFGRQVDASEIIDGQQRLTTLQVFLGAFRDLVEKVDEGAYRELCDLTANRNPPDPDARLETACPPILVNHRKALDFLLRQIARMRKHLPTRQKLKAILRERIAKHLAHGREATERRQKEIVQVESEINRLLDQVSKGLLLMSDPFVRKNYEALKERHETLKNSPAREVTADEIKKVTAQYLEKAEALFDSFEKTFKKAPLDLQKALLAQVMERFEVDPRQRKVTFFLYDLPALRIEDGDGVGLKGVGNGSKPVVWEPSLNGTHIKPRQEAAPTKMTE